MTNVTVTPSSLPALFSNVWQTIGEDYKHLEKADETEAPADTADSVIMRRK